MLHHPNIDPIFLEIGPLAIRWYGLSYLLGLYSGLSVVRSRLSQRLSLNGDNIHQFVISIMIGLLIGGRLGYVLFYNFFYFVQHPIEIFSIWQGGMSYHGGGIGAVVGVLLFAKQHRVSRWALLDSLALGSTLAVFFGRLGNFINQELVGHVTTVPWAMIFPLIDGQPRHPSQLYEACGEGLLLFAILWFVDAYLKPKPGIVIGTYLIGYGIIRFFLEFFREPDAHIGLIADLFSMGQGLCSIMIFLGIGIIWLRQKNDT